MLRMTDSLGRSIMRLYAGLLAALVITLARPARAQEAPVPHTRADVIAVTFRDGLSVRLREGRPSDLGTGGLAPAAEVLAHLEKDGCRWERAYPDVSEE